jgi:outer membrane lipoprotein SlyB
MVQAQKDILGVAVIGGAALGAAVATLISLKAFSSAEAFWPILGAVVGGIAGALVRAGVKRTSPETPVPTKQ